MQSASSQGTPLARCLPLSIYERQLCKRLAASVLTDSSVRQMAKVVLDMSSSDDLDSLSVCRGLTLLGVNRVRDTYKKGGLHEVLNLKLKIHGSPRDDKAVLLTDLEESFCRSTVEDSRSSRGRLRRARILLLLNQGKSTESIALTIGVHERTVLRTSERYQADGAEGAVNGRKGTGRPVRYSKAEYVPLIRTVVDQDLGGNHVRVTTQQIRRALVRRCPEAGHMSKPTLRGLIRAAGLPDSNDVGDRKRCA